MSDESFFTLPKQGLISRFIERIRDFLRRKPLHFERCTFWYREHTDWIVNWKKSTEILIPIPVINDGDRLIALKRNLDTGELEEIPEEEDT